MLSVVALALVTLTLNHLSERHPTPDVATGDQMSPADRVRWAQSTMEHKVYELGASAAEVAQLETLVRFVEHNPDSQCARTLYEALMISLRRPRKAPPDPRSSKPSFSTTSTSS